MKIPIICSQCSKEFEGEEWLAEKSDPLCPECYKEKTWADEHLF